MTELKYSEYNVRYEKYSKKNSIYYSYLIKLWYAV